MAKRMEVEELIRGLCEGEAGILVGNSCHDTPKWTQSAFVTTKQTP